MNVLVIGGTAAHPGGVEAFCERSKEALDAQGDIRLAVEPADTAFLPLHGLPGLLRRLVKLFRGRSDRPDGVWVQYVNLPDLAYVWAAKVAGYRVMVTPHLGSNWRSQSRPLLRWISRSLIGRADRLALISRTQELEIGLPPALPRSHIRNFLPISLWQQPVPPPNEGAELQLIHSGRLSEGKGTFLFVDLCAQLRDRGVPFHARITGGADAETMARLHGMIEKADLRDEVEVLGRVPDDELLRLLRASDVLVHLSRIDSYPLIVLESLACGIFPICMELAGARDMIETYAGQVVSEATPVQEVADFLASVDPQAMRQDTIAAAHRVRADYGWDNCASVLRDALTATFRKG